MKIDKSNITILCTMLNVTRRPIRFPFYFFYCCFPLLLLLLFLESAFFFGADNLFHDFFFEWESALCFASVVVVNCELCAARIFCFDVILSSISPLYM